MLFGLALLGLAWLTEKALDFGLAHNYDFKPSLVVAGHTRPDALFLGNSRVELMLNPAVFSQHTGLSAYNLGFNGSSLIQQLALLNLWLRHNPAPKYLFVEVSPENLQHSDLGFFSIHFLQDLHAPPFEDLVRRYDPRLLTLSRIPLLKYSLYNQVLVGDALVGLFRWLTGREQTLQYPGGYDPTPFVDFDETFDNYRQQHPGGIVMALDTGRVHKLGQLFRFARSKGIQVVAYEAPTLGQMLRLHRNRPAMEAVIDSVCRAEAVPFLPVDTTYLCPDRRYFFNANHLNAQGTDLFSKRLAERVRDRLIK
ncbi:MAG: hypothetical protein LH606_18015 [Cytophagaceae bacterium]|nr:hypothetical protein [Cytophagaceae bacterium]